MSTKSLLRSFGTAFTVGGRGINTILDKRRAAHEFDVTLKTQKTLKERELELKTELQDQQKNHEAEMARMEQERNDMQDRMTKLHEAQGKRDEKKFGWDMAGMYAAYVIQGQRHQNMMWEGRRLQQEFENYVSPAEMKKSYYQWAEGMAKINNNVAFKMSGLRFEREKYFKDQQMGTQFTLQLLNEATKYFSMGDAVTDPEGKLKRGAKASLEAAEEYLKTINVIGPQTQIDAAKESVREAIEGDTFYQPQTVGEPDVGLQGKVQKTPGLDRNKLLVDPGPIGTVQGGAAPTGFTSAPVGGKAPVPFSGMLPSKGPDDAPDVGPAPKVGPAPVIPGSPAQLDPAVDPEDFVWNIIQKGAMGLNITMDDIQLVDQIGATTDVVQKLLEGNKLTQSQVDRYHKRVQEIAAEAVQKRTMTQQEKQDQRRKQIQFNRGFSSGS